VKKIVAEQKAGEPLGLEPDSDVWRLFFYARKSPVTRDKYQQRLSRFFEFAGVNGASLQAKALSIIQKATTDSTWVFTIILRFLEQQNARVNNREIGGATVRNYVKAIKLFCEMAELSVSWKKLTRGPRL
jgi:hypothetical protein